MKEKINTKEIVEKYLKNEDWKVNENSNSGYSLSGLMLNASNNVLARYTLDNMYPAAVSRAHENGDIHLHDLGMGITGYCAGWSLEKLLVEGINGIPGKVDSDPPSHLDSAVWQIINFIGVLQNEWSGAQSFSSFDTWLSPFIKYDNLSYKKVKQCIQGFIYNMNTSSRWGGQTPFSNLTFDWVCPDDLKDKQAIIGGIFQDFTYAECQKEMDMINKAFLEVMREGDANGRIFTFPIPTYNITEDFNWESENTDLLMHVTAKYGLPYFQLFVNSELEPKETRSMCCRLRMDLRELDTRGGGLFGSNDLVGSLGVVTINLPRIGYFANNERSFFERLSYLMTLAKISLEIKRKIVQKNIDNGLMPYTKRYLKNLNHHFSTIGLIGMNECLLNFLGIDMTTKKGINFSKKVLNFMREKLKDFQESTGHLFNLEATPGEGASYRLAKKDKDKYPDIITAGKGKEIYYTNSTQLPVDAELSLEEALNKQDDIQCLYTGGTVLHAFLGESFPDIQGLKQLITAIAYNYHLPYLTISPTYSLCPICGYINGEEYICPNSHDEFDLYDLGLENDCVSCEVFSRVVGYYRPISQWNKGKQQEFMDRKEFDKIESKITRTDKKDRIVRIPTK